MATATVYTLDEKNIVVDQFNCEWNEAVGRYHGKRNNRGRYFIALKDKPIPYNFKRKPLKNIYPNDQTDTDHNQQLS